MKGNVCRSAHTFHIYIVASPINSNAHLPSTAFHRTLQHYLIPASSKSKTLLLLGMVILVGHQRLELLQPPLRVRALQPRVRGSGTERARDLTCCAVLSSSAVS